MARTHVKFVRFKLNRTNVELIAIGPRARSMVHDAAEKAKAVAVSLSPHSGDPEKDHYAEQFKVNVDTLTGFPKRNPITGAEPMNRAAGVLYNKSEYALAVEWGWTIFDGDNNAVGYREGHDVLLNTLRELAVKHLAEP